MSIELSERILFLLYDMTKSYLRKRTAVFIISKKNPCLHFASVSRLHASLNFGRCISYRARNVKILFKDGIECRRKYSTFSFYFHQLIDCSEFGCSYKPKWHFVSIMVLINLGVVGLFWIGKSFSEAYPYTVVVCLLVNHSIVMVIHIFRSRTRCYY